MKYFAKLFFTVILLTSILGVTLYIIDPYDKFSHNYLHLKTKGVFDNRTNKFLYLKTHQNIYEAFILGSSRGMQLQPKIMQKYTGYKTFNYSVYTANPQDYLAMTRYIVQTQKPKLIWIHLDFFAFNKNMPTEPKLFKSPLKLYISHKTTPSSQADSSFIYFATHYYSYNAFWDAYIVVNKNLKGKIEKHFSQDGVNFPAVQTKKTYPLLNGYWDMEYKNYTISTERLKMLKEIKKLCEEHHIKLLISLSPVSYPHWQKIKNDPQLYAQIFKVKKDLCNIFGGFEDFFNENVKNYSTANFWMDSVHPSTLLGEQITTDMFAKQKSNLIKEDNCSN